MTILKRLAIWLLERVIEAPLLGVLLAFLSGMRLSEYHRGAWIFGVLVAVFLFRYGYYFTTAIAGIVARRPGTRTYPLLITALYAAHMHFLFMQVGPDFTTEARAMELPLILAGSVIAFACSWFGNLLLDRWVREEPTNVYTSAVGIALLALTLANIADLLRPPVAGEVFAESGFPFAFYRDGGFIGESYVFQSATILWWGLVGDLVFALSTGWLGGTLWKRWERRRNSG